MLMMILIFSFMLCVGFMFMILNFLLSEFLMENKNSNSSFECGMENNMITRIPFSLQFFLIGLIFIVFDLEVIILLNFLPFNNNLQFLIMFTTFLVFVTASLLYEWKFKKLIWMK